MLSYIFILFILNLVENAQSLQTGFTCETSVSLTCPSSRKLVILEAIYSSECPKFDDKENGSSIYAPSRCIGYYRDRTSSLCSGQQTCTIDNNLEQRPSFFIGKHANCAFKSQSINIEYSCIPDVHSSKLPRIDICSLQSLEDITEGFIHTPNYPDDYVTSRTCSKVVPAPDSGHRLKIYALDFNLISSRGSGATRNNDWLEINSNGNKLKTIEQPFTLLFDDVIEASLTLKSLTTNDKLLHKNFLLYFIVTSVRRSRPSTTTQKTTRAEIPEVVHDEKSISFIEEKPAALIIEKQRRNNNTGLILLVILLSGILFVILCGFLLYKRRNDRRVRYLTETFHSFFPNRVKSWITDSSDAHEQSNTKCTHDQDKLISISPHKTGPHSSEFDHIYSEDPLNYRNQQGPNALIYGNLDCSQHEPHEEVIYEIIHPNEEKANKQHANSYLNMYVIPQDNNQ